MNTQPEVTLVQETGFYVSEFNNETDNQPKVKSLTWAQLKALAQKPIIRFKKNGKAFAPFTFQGTRAKENAQKASILAIDCDDGTPLEEIKTKCIALGYSFVLYTTHSHTLEKHKYRVVFLLTEPIPAKFWPQLWQWVAKQFPNIDPAPKSTASIFYYPAKKAKDSPYYTESFDGKPLDWREVLLSTLAEDSPLAQQSYQRQAYSTTTNSNSANYIQAALDGEVAIVRSATKGERNTTVNKAAFALSQFLHTNLIDETTIKTELENAALSVGLSRDEARRTIESAIAAGCKHPRPIPDRGLQQKPYTVNRPEQPSDNSLFNSDNSNYTNDHSRDNIQNEDDTKPNINISNRQLSVIISVAWRAVLQANTTPEYYRRGGKLVRLNCTDSNGVKIEVATSVAIYGQLVRCANWFRTDDKGRIKATKPPKELGADFCEFPSPNLPEIEMVTSSPTFTKDGEAITTAGYHPKEKLFYSPPANFCISPIPAKPIQKDIEMARIIIVDELLGDFPFVSQSERAHAIAAILLPFVIRLIDSPTPLHLIEASERGSGKSLLSKIISLVCTGEEVEARTFPSNEEEVRKVITAELTKARSVILLDNISGMLISDSLAAVLTSTKWTDRILGETCTISLTNRALWLATGNNASLGADFIRRILRIRLDPNMEKPWERTEFKHPELISWVRNNREKLVQAVMTLIQAWLVAGRPSGKKTLGSFESWASVIGGILEVVGVPGFLDNSQELYEVSNAEDALWRELVKEWYAEFKDKPVRTNTLNTFCEQYGLLTSIRGSENERSQQTRLGRALKRNRDRIFAGYKIIQSNSTDEEGRGGRIAYAVVLVGKKDPAKPDFSPNLARPHEVKSGENYALLSTTCHTRQTSPDFFQIASHEEKASQNNEKENIYGLGLQKSLAKSGEGTQTLSISMKSNDLVSPDLYTQPTTEVWRKSDLLGEKPSEAIYDQKCNTKNVDAPLLSDKLSSPLNSSELQKLLNLDSQFCDCGTEYKFSHHQPYRLAEASCPSCQHTITTICDD